MILPPIGSNAGQIPIPDETRTENSQPQKADAKPQVEKQAPVQVNASRVEFSKEAEAIRARQSEISGLQAAERTAEQIASTGETVNALVLTHLDAAREYGKDAEAIHARIDAHLRQMEALANDANYEGQNNLDGRVMQFQIGGRTETIQTPDMKSGVDNFVKNTREAVIHNAPAVKSREAGTTEVVKQAREFGANAKKVREKLTQEVRESIAGAVRESSGAKVKDAADAERLIKQARESQQKSGSKPNGNMNQIEGQAINLLK
ncbi:MAG: hypothetical protein NTY09_06950 [bacterium]|nr:hypothetical protein [bacterium]